MQIIHVSAECYPMAKAGGLGDVVGALPKYQNNLGHKAIVVMPMYRTPFLYKNEWDVVFENSTYLGNTWFRYAIIKCRSAELGYDLYLLDINGLLDREKVYGYDDDTERFISFQNAFMHWLNTWQELPDVVHVHDHHTALIPFIMKYGRDYGRLRSIRSVLTIHNAQYQGSMGWNKSHYLPAFDPWKWGMLEWNNSINPLAAGVKCADKVTTVSPSYMEELRESANGLEKLFEYERGKCIGILNGIDNDFWNPATDPMLLTNYDVTNVSEGKLENKQVICQQFGLQPELPLFIFIGRLVGEKAAEILPSVIGQSIDMHKQRLNFIVLGSGESKVEYDLQSLQQVVPDNFGCYIGYNEQLAHRLYAAADFLLMPSRVEPCGLNQMYAMRYGTVPMVRNTGGLRDTVIDIGEPDSKGFGLVFNHASVYDVNESVHRAMGWFYEKPEVLDEARERMMKIDNSWEKSAQHYIDIYQ